MIEIALLAIALLVITLTLGRAATLLFRVRADGHVFHG